jgi:hypothetical protein
MGTLTVGESVEFPKDVQGRYVLAALEVLWATGVMQCSDIKLTPMQVHLSLIGIGQVLPHTNFTVAMPRHSSRPAAHMVSKPSAPRCGHEAVTSPLRGGRPPCRAFTRASSRPRSRRPSSRWCARTWSTDSGMARAAAPPDRRLLVARGELPGCATRPANAPEA